MKTSKNFVKNIIILLLVALCIILALQVYPIPKSFRGTYIMGLGTPIQPFNLVLKGKSDEYVMYYQTDQFDKGTFEISEFGRNIVVLNCTSNKGEPNFVAVIYKDELLLAYDDHSRNGDILKKYSDHEFYVGTPVDD